MFFSEITATRRCVSINLLECDVNNATVALIVSETTTQLEETLALIGGRCSNPCFNEPCLNGGSCTASFDFESYTCACQPGYYGDQCQNGQFQCKQTQLTGSTC